MGVGPAVVPGDGDQGDPGLEVQAVSKPGPVGADLSTTVKLGRK